MKKLLCLFACACLTFVSTSTVFATPSLQDIVYMSDIDGLVKAVMLYGMTNGITYNGTNYMFVVEPVAARRSVLKKLEPTLQMEKVYEMKLGNVISVNELIFTDSTGKMKVESSNSEVAKVITNDKLDQYITCVGQGTSLITVTLMENDVYTSVSKSFELVVFEE